MELFNLCVYIIGIQIFVSGSMAQSYEEDWVDPFDMINYDRTTKTMIQKSRDDNPSEDVAEDVTHLQRCNRDLNMCKNQLAGLKTRLSTKVPSPNCDETEQKTANDLKKQQACTQSELYMRRFVTILLKATKLNEEMPLKLDTTLRISVTLEQLKTLQMFSHGQDVSLRELEGVLSSVLLAASSDIFSPDNLLWLSVRDLLLTRETLLAIVLGFLPIVIMWKILRGHSLIRIVTVFLVVSFIFSFSVTYCRMYKEEEIRQYSILKKNPAVPAHCRPPADLSWSETLSNMVKSKLHSHGSDDCLRYYEAIMMDPFLKITPTLVLSEMIGSFFLHPSAMLGNAIALFSKAILGNLPFGTNYIVLFGSFCLVVALVFASCGGVLRLPFYLGGIELRGGRPEPQVQRGNNQPTIQASEHEHLSSLLQAVDSSSSGLIITNARALQILSRGKVLLEEDVTAQGMLTEAAHVPGCCGESNTRCQHNEFSLSGNSDEHPGTQPKKNRVEELRLRKTVAVVGEPGGGALNVLKLRETQLEGRIEIIQPKERVECTCMKETVRSGEEENGDNVKILKEILEETEVSISRKSSVSGVDDEEGFVKV